MISTPYNLRGSLRIIPENNVWRLLELTSSPPHRESTELTREQFDTLLGWLNPDRELAGQKYESIRKRLLKVFGSCGSSIPEELADLTMNRVARKVPEIRDSYTGDPAAYFCGVAVNIFRESLRKNRIPAVQPPARSGVDEFVEEKREWLETCMDKLPPQDRHLVVAYYELEKRAKIDRRREIAESMGVSVNALRIRACRIRADLMKCVESCRRRPI